MNYELSTIDKQRFNVVTAKAFLENGDDVHLLFNKSKLDDVDFLVVRVSTDQLKIVQMLEQKGAFLTDTLICYFKKKITSYEENLPKGYNMRLATGADSVAIEGIAFKTFEGYLGHYHSDPNLEKYNCDLVYSSWAASSCNNKNVADAVVLLEKEREIVAFATIKIINTTEISGILFGVLPEHRNKNLYLSLMHLSESWGKNNDFNQMSVSTQITNIVVQKYWTRLGFEPKSSYYTFHKWFK